MAQWKSEYLLMHFKISEGQMFEFVEMFSLQYNPHVLLEFCFICVFLNMLN